MRIILKTAVPGNYKEVIELFNEDLFLALKPPGASLELVEFGGSKTGDRVNIRFGFPINKNWISVITDDGVNKRSAWFIDKGLEMPFGLKKWQHKHLVHNDGPNRSIIEDNIQFHGPNILINYFLYVLFYIQFSFRKPVYKRFFKRRFG